MLPAGKEYDIIFLITGKPLPAMLDMAFFSQKAGQRTLMVVLERGIDDLKVDKALIDYDYININVPYKQVDLKRLFSLPSVYRKLRSLVRSHLKSNGILYTSSYDLLLFGRMIAAGKNYRIRHQVRDLHHLQLGTNLKSKAFRSLETFLLKKVECIVVSSSGFIDKYYGDIYEGKKILLENTPSASTWESFRRERDESVFRIGYIGIIRYKKSLYQLIDAVQSLASEGIRIKVRFAGGGNTEDIRQRITRPELFEFEGSYEYTKDIKRLYKDLDLIYAVYDSYDLNCQVAMPNKFYEAIISKIPIVVAKNTFLEKEVKRVGIGEAVLSEDVESLKSLLSDAVEFKGWYKQSLDNLNRADANEYFAAYEHAMHESIS